MDISRASFLTMLGALTAYIFFTLFKNELLTILPHWFIYGAVAGMIFLSILSLVDDFITGRNRTQKNDR